MIEPEQQVTLVIPRELARRILQDLSILDSLAPKSFVTLGSYIRRSGS
jgi:hypothetical protein